MKGMSSVATDFVYMRNLLLFFKRASVIDAFVNLDLGALRAGALTKLVT